MPFDLLKKKLLSRLNTMGIKVTKTYEEVRALAMLALSNRLFATYSLLLAEN